MIDQYSQGNMQKLLIISQRLKGAFSLNLVLLIKLKLPPVSEGFWPYISHFCDCDQAYLNQHELKVMAATCKVKQKENHLKYTNLKISILLKNNLHFPKSTSTYRQQATAAVLILRCSREIERQQDLIYAHIYAVHHKHNPLHMLAEALKESSHSACREIADVRELLMTVVDLYLLFG